MAAYTITYNANGGTGAPASQTTGDDGKLMISSTLPTRAGYTFVIWNDNQDGSGRKRYPDTTYTFSSDKTLYAIWAPNKSFLNYNSNGGQGAPDAELNIAYGSVIRISDTIPTKTGYTFLGWSNTVERANAGLVDYLPGSLYLNDALTPTKTIYAAWLDDSWEKVETYMRTT